MLISNERYQIKDISL